MMHRLINLLFYLFYFNRDDRNNQYHNKQEQYRETKKSNGQVENWKTKDNALYQFSSPLHCCIIVSSACLLERHNNYDI